MLDFLPDLDLGVFSQIALIECTTDGDLEYFLDMASIFFFDQCPIIRHGIKKKKNKKKKIIFIYTMPDDGTSIEKKN